MKPEAYREIAAQENRHWWFLARRKIIDSIIGGLALPPSSSILEIGAGTGGNLAMLSRYGNVWAAEMDDYARGFAKEQSSGQIPIEYGMCPDQIPFEDVKFDLICMFDVLEHVEQDVETLNVLRDRLADNGKLLITVPAYQWLWSGHDEFLHHKRRYTKRAMIRKLQNAGFDIERATYFNSLLLPLAALVRLKDRMLNRQVDSVNDLPSQPLNASLAAVFGSERALLNLFNLPAGVSLLAIAKRG